MDNSSRCNMALDNGNCARPEGHAGECADDEQLFFLTSIAALEARVTALQARNSELVTERRAWRMAAEEASGWMLRAQLGTFTDGAGGIVALGFYREAVEDLKR